MHTPGNVKLLAPPGRAGGSPVVDGRVAREADYVCYWFEKARAAVVAGRAQRVGLLATNSLRQGKNREVLGRILRDTSVFFAESDREWTLEGASVRVSMVGFGITGSGEPRVLDGKEVIVINADLTGGLDLSIAGSLLENAGMSFIGDQKTGPFEIPEALAVEWLAMPLNPNGRPNSDVLRPWANGKDITERPQHMWIIDFGMPLARGAKPTPGMLHLSEVEASFYEAPYTYASSRIKPFREQTRTQIRAWWMHEKTRPDMRRATFGLGRFLVTPRVSKHRLFSWLNPKVLPDTRLVVVATDQDGLFGILQSRIHDLWSIGSCGWHGVGNDPQYGVSVFESFPLPKDVSAPITETLTEGAKRLHEARDRWLNPEGANEATLKQRTLTALYNEREAGRATWLNNLHRDLDRAVLAAYGWSDLAEALFAAEDALKAANPQGNALGLALGRTEAGQALLGRLLALNLERSKGSGV